MFWQCIDLSAWKRDDSEARSTRVFIVYIVPNVPITWTRSSVYDYYHLDDTCQGLTTHGPMILRIFDVSCTQPASKNQSFLQKLQQG